MNKIKNWFVRHKDLLLYILKRISIMLVTFIVVTVLLFVLIRLLVPPVITYGPDREIEEARREALGYNKPIINQLFIFIKNIFTRWDFGTSWKISYLEDANKLFYSSLPATLLVNVYAAILIIPAGIGLGIFGALNKGKFIDTILNVFVMIIISLPSFVIALLVQYYLGFKAGLPTTTSSLFDADGSYFSPTMLLSQLLPVIALFIPGTLSLARFVRAEMVETLHSENVYFARSLGVPNKKIVFRYAFKNALVPLLPIILGFIISVFAGSIVIEKVFSIPGVGSLMIEAIEKLDYDVFMICAMFYTFVGLLSGLIIDLAYSFVDPRIRMGGGRYHVR